MVDLASNNRQGHVISYPGVCFFIVAEGILPAGKKQQQKKTSCNVHGRYRGPTEIPGTNRYAHPLTRANSFIQIEAVPLNY